jgi:hypothetical protein
MFLTLRASLSEPAHKNEPFWHLFEYYGIHFRTAFSKRCLEGRTQNRIHPGLADCAKRIKKSFIFRSFFPILGQLFHSFVAFWHNLQPILIPISFVSGISLNILGSIFALPFLNGALNDEPKIEYILAWRTVPSE